jgi:PIN domain nuclease of toxin-antitoxin system
MNLLLDTNVFIHWVLDTERLSKTVYDTLIDPENTIFLSTISVWEIQIKSSLGKLDIGGDLSEVVSEQQQQNGFIILNLSLKHIYNLDRILPHHRDPFD